MARIECDRCGMVYEGDRCHTRCPLCGAEVTCSDSTIYLTETEQIDTSALVSTRISNYQIREAGIPADG